MLKILCDMLLMAVAVFLIVAIDVKMFGGNEEDDDK